MAFDTHDENTEQTPVKPLSADDTTTMEVTIDGETMTVEQALHRHSGALDALTDDRDAHSEELENIHTVIEGALNRVDEQNNRISILEQQVGELYEAVEVLAEATSGSEGAVTWDYRNAKP